VFQVQFKTIAGHNCWIRQEKSTYLITKMLHGVPKGATYKKTLRHWRTISGTTTWLPCITIR
jgi:hypothetical protein